MKFSLICLLFSSPFFSSRHFIVPNFSRLLSFHFISFPLRFLLSFLFLFIVAFTRILFVFIPFYHNQSDYFMHFSPVFIQFSQKFIRIHSCALLCPTPPANAMQSTSAFIFSALAAPLHSSLSFDRTFNGIDCISIIQFLYCSRFV